MGKGKFKGLQKCRECRYQYSCDEDRREYDCVYGDYDDEGEIGCGVKWNREWDKESMMGNFVDEISGWMEKGEGE